MPKYSKSETVTNGETTTISIPENYENIRGEQIKWNGNSETNNFSHDGSHSNHENAQRGNIPYSYTVDFNLPNNYTEWNPSQYYDLYLQVHRKEKVFVYDQGVPLYTPLDQEITFEYEVVDVNGNVLDSGSRTHDHTASVRDNQVVSGYEHSPVWIDHANITVTDATFGEFGKKKDGKKNDEIVLNNGHGGQDGSRTETNYTEDPAVSISETGSSASYNGVLSGSTGWYDVSFTKGTNTFSHSVGGINDVDITYEYTYDAAPTPVEITKVKHSDGTVYELPLVDPSDSMLEYNTNIRIAVGGQKLTPDLVDVGDPDASPVRVQTQYGTLAWRKDVS